LLRIEELAPPKAHELALALAAWFHDAVYQPDRDDNEERSAYVAYDALEQAGASPDLMADVMRLIRLTASHSPAPDDIAGLVLCDADLSILGAPRDKYVQYARDIRQEYVHVPVTDYHAGRGHVLRTFLNRAHIYQTPFAREQWEAQARSNIAAELSCFDDEA
jgi:predicted metal-dependent HD superfamily phosphohydrolase